MATVKAFKGLLPVPERAPLVAAVPYDVVSSEEAAEVAKFNAYSFLRISRPEIELEEGVDIYCSRIYEKAAENFRRLTDAAPLRLDPEPHVYIYTLKMGSHEQTGVAAVFSVDEYNSGIIKKHEKTRKDKEDDRTRHIQKLRSHTGPVFLTYRDSSAIDKLVEKIKKDKPLFDFTAQDGIRHSFWRAGVTESARISELFAKIPSLYIADGHHRAAAAARTAAECRKKSGKPGEYDDFLAVVFPATQLRIMPYNRLVKDLNGLKPEEFKKKISESFEIRETASPAPSKPCEICMFLKGKWFKLKPNFDISDLGVTERLDVSILQDRILDPILGIKDPRTDKRIDFVGGIRGTKELEKSVADGKAEVAFSMFPTTVSQLMDIADAGEIMPPKSTWFEPKLRDGIVCHNF